MTVLLSYDVSGRHTEVKEAMIRRGYSGVWNINGNFVPLPNTTLWKDSVMSLQMALDDIAAVAVAFGVRLERAVAVDYTQGLII